MTNEEVRLQGEILAQGLVLSILMREPGRDIRSIIAHHIEHGPADEHLSGYALPPAQQRILVHSFRHALDSIFKASIVADIS